jgi:hypothetical protein
MLVMVGFVVVERVRCSHFKRVLTPIGKLSNRTVGYDLLYLRDWGKKIDVSNKWVNHS